MRSARRPILRLLALLALPALLDLMGVRVGAAARAPGASPPSRGAVSVRVPGAAALHAYGTRGTQQRTNAATARPGMARLGAVLADLSRHAGRARPGRELADLHALSPAAHFRQSAPGATPLVLIDAVTHGNPQALEASLLALGLRGASVYGNDVGGWLPVTQIDAAAAAPALQGMRAAMFRTRAGSVTSQGDFAQGSEALRSTYATLTGAGVTVGVLSDSYDCYAVYAQPGSGVPAAGNEGYAPNGFLADAQQDVASGDLPAGVDVLEEAPCLDYGYPTQLPFTDEGRAMLQIVHDVAPGAALSFYTADDSEADFANGIDRLAAAGARVEADDTGYFDEPFFQDGIVAQAIDAVEAQGVAYFSAAGNDGTLSYENTAPSFSTLATGGPNAGEYLLNFDASGATTATALPVTIPPLYPGEFVAIVVQWDQPYVTGAPGSPGASSAIDLCITGASGRDQITDLDGDAVSCTGANAIGADPVQILIVANPANAGSNTATEHLQLELGLAGGTEPPGRVKLAVEDDGAGSSIDAFATGSSTLQGHPGAAGAAAVGAAFFAQTPRCGISPAVLESYSSAGGAPILFDTAGNRLATPVVRQKPDFVGPDGVNDTFLGYTLASAGLADDSTVSQCQNQRDFPNFFGTSAATPHAAAIAALMMQANGAITPAQIYQALRASAAGMGGAVPSFQSGYGFIQADAALALLPPGAPVLSLTASSIALGSSATLSWSSINTTGCSASGNWSGTQAISGSQVVTPSSTGTATYALSCTNAAGSAASSVTLSVVAAGSSSSSGSGGSSGSAGSGGGGALDGLTLAVLAALAAAQMIGRRRPARH